jgi:cystathionine beta-lyase/cystathionine gamma-synthase
MTTSDNNAPSTDNNALRPETFAAQAGGAVDRETGAIILPIHLTTTYERDSDLTYPKGLIYGRPDNATIRQAEAVITHLEAGDHTLLFPSGMAAATTALLALDPPAHIVAPRVMYWSLRNWLATAARRYRIEATKPPPIPSGTSPTSRPLQQSPMTRARSSPSIQPAPPPC